MITCNLILLQFERAPKSNLDQSIICNKQQQANQTNRMQIKSAIHFDICLQLADIKIVLQIDAKAKQHANSYCCRWPLNG